MVGNLVEDPALKPSPEPGSTFIGVVLFGALTLMDLVPAPIPQNIHAEHQIIPPLHIRST